MFLWSQARYTITIQQQQQQQQQGSRKYHTLSPVRHLLRLHTRRQSQISYGAPGEYVENVHYLLQRGVHEVTANAARHYHPLCENMTSSTKPEVHNVLAVI